MSGKVASGRDLPSCWPLGPIGTKLEDFGVSYKVNIRGVYTEDDGYRLELGKLKPGEAWHDKPLPHCPDCGGDLICCEDGYLPGTRKCVGYSRLPGHKVYAKDGGCGSMFSVRTDDQQSIYIQRERFYS